VEDRILYVIAEVLGDRVEVEFQTIGGQLHAIGKTALEIVNENPRRVGVAAADHPAVTRCSGSSGALFPSRPLRLLFPLALFLEELRYFKVEAVVPLRGFHVGHIVAR
jgi:hypothetical protein